MYQKEEGEGIREDMVDIDGHGSCGVIDLQDKIIDMREWRE